MGNEYLWWRVLTKYRIINESFDQICLQIIYKSSLYTSGILLDGSIYLMTPKN